LGYKKQSKDIPEVVHEQASVCEDDSNYQVPPDREDDFSDESVEKD